MRYIFLIGLLLTFSCKKNKNDSQAEVFPSGTFVDVPMTVLYTGPVAADGCDWCLVDSGFVYFSPENLDVSFKVNNTQVFVTYRYAGTRFGCGNSIPNKGPAVVNILGVRK